MFRVSVTMSQPPHAEHQGPECEIGQIRTSNPTHLTACKQARLSQEQELFAPKGEDRQGKPEKRDGTLVEDLGTNVDLERMLASISSFGFKV